LTKKRPVVSVSAEKGHTEQTLFAPAHDCAAPVEEVAREKTAVLRNSYVAVLLHDEPGVPAHRILDGRHRSYETGDLDARPKLRGKL
jgi:hypothetical protein